MKATSYSLVLFGLFFAANASAGEQDAAGTATDKGGTTAICALIAWKHFPQTYITLEGQDQEIKLTVHRVGPYGTLRLGNLLCNRLYKLRFEPPDDAYSFTAVGNRVLKLAVYGYDGQEGKTPDPVPAVLLALPLPSTPFFIRPAFGGSAEQCPQVRSMAEFNAATSTVWYVKPAEKGAAGPYANSNLYVKFYGGCQLALEDSTLKPTLSIIEPEDGETVSGIFIARAQFPTEVGLTEMDFIMDGAILGKDWLEFGNNFHLAPYRVLIDTRMVTDGPHEITAIAYCSSRPLVPSEKLTFNVNNSLAGAPAKQPANK